MINSLFRSGSISPRPSAVAGSCISQNEEPSERDANQSVDQHEAPHSHDHNHGEGHDDEDHIPGDTNLEIFAAGGHSHDAPSAFLFEDTDQEKRLREQGALVKESGHPLNPFGSSGILNYKKGGGLRLNNARTYFNSMLHGKPELSNRMVPLQSDEDLHFIFIDGADELAQIVGASDHIREEVAAAIQATMIFPPAIGPTLDGFRGAVSEFEEAWHVWGDLGKFQTRSWSDIKNLVDQFLEKNAAHHEIAELIRQGSDDRSRASQLLARIFKANMSANSVAELSDAEAIASLIEAIENSHNRPLAEKMLRVFANVKAGGIAEKKDICDQLFKLILAEEDLLSQKIKWVNGWLAGMGTGVMWWALVALEAAAIANMCTLGGVGAVAQRIAEFILPFGQGAMVGFGGGSILEGSRCEKKLKAYLEDIEANEDKLGPNLCQTLRAQVGMLQLLNRTGRIVSGGILSAGQANMIAGGVTGMFPMFLAGATGTVVGVAGRVSTELIREARFGCNTTAFKKDYQNIEQEVINDLSLRSEAVTTKELSAANIEKLKNYRDISIENLAWIKALKWLYKQMSLKPHLNPKELVEQLELAAPKIYTRASQQEHQSKLNDIIKNQDNLHIFEKSCQSLENLTKSMIAVQQNLRSNEETNDLGAKVLQSILKFEDFSEVGKMKNLRKELISLGMMAETKRLLAQQLLIAKKGWDGSKNPYIDGEKPYFQTEKIREWRRINLPQLVTMKSWTISMPKVMAKKKHAYILDENVMIDDMQSRPFDRRTAEAVKNFHKAALTALFTNYKYQVRSKYLGSNIAILRNTERTRYMGRNEIIRA